MPSTRGDLKAGGCNHLKAHSLTCPVVDANLQLRLQLGFWWQHLHVASLCCLDFLITWWLGSHGKNPEKASQGPHCLLWHSLQSPIVPFPSHSTGQGITKVKGQEYCSVRHWKIQHAQTHRVVIYTIPSNSIISWKNIVCACVCPQYYTHELIVVRSCFYFFSLILNYNVIISP